ncbi:MAG: phage tail protein [Bacteroidota bacterium]
MEDENKENDTPGLSPYSPHLSFYFTLSIAGMEAGSECSFQEIGRLNTLLETQTIEEGGPPDYPHKLPFPPKYDNLILKRGFIRGTHVLEWIEDATENFKFNPKQIVVSLMDGLNKKRIEWVLHNAYPVSLKISYFKAEDNSVAIETLEIAYNYFERNDF